jgi:hypothetical protein
MVCSSSALSEWRVPDAWSERIDVSGGESVNKNKTIDRHNIIDYHTINPLILFGGGRHCIISVEKESNKYGVVGG